MGAAIAQWYAPGVERTTVGRVGAALPIEGSQSALLRGLGRPRLLPAALARSWRVTGSAIGAAERRPA